MTLEVTERELRRITDEFNLVANQLLATSYVEYWLSNDGMRNLARFLNLVENQPILLDFIQQKTSYLYNFSELELQKISNQKYEVPISHKEVIFIYQFLQAGLKKNQEKPDVNNFIHLASYLATGENHERILRNFKNIIKPLINSLSSYLNSLGIEQKIKDEGSGNI